MPYPEDTAPIRDDERFDEERLASYIRASIPELAEAFSIEFAQFPGGKANLTYLVRAGDVELVLRRPPHGPTAPGAHDMAREYQVLSALWRVYPLAPRAYHFCADPAVMGKEFFVMERRHGVVIGDSWPETFPNDDAVRGRLARELVAALSSLHVVDYEAIGLGDLGRPDNFVRRQVEGWTKRWHLAKSDDLEVMDRLAGVLSGNVPEPQAATILHNDFKLDNTMVDFDGNVVGVFDWDMATLGDPLVDLGTALAYWADPSEPVYELFADEGVTLSPYMSRDEVTQNYAEQTGFDLSQLGFYEALAMFRLTVIIQQIYIRFVRGQTQDERFAEMGEMVPALAQMGMERAGRI